MKSTDARVNIIGAGLAGLSAARTCAQAGVRVRLVSFQPSERAQSNLAEGGINAALDVMGENDTTQEHFLDTMKGGCYLADPNMVRALTQEAPSVVKDLDLLGVPFHREKDHLIQRNFGGQKKKRTAYAKSSTGKVLTAALIDAVRRFEAEGLVERYPHHRFERLILENDRVCGALVYDRFRKEELVLEGPVLMACGGMNGLFAGATTGTTANTGSAAAALFAQGVEFGNLEFLQYHPTTVSITGKRLLVSEAARGEGGRLFCLEDGKKRYFMEEKYGERGNLMPRDVISREMAMLGSPVYLDLTVLDDAVWRVKLPDLRDEIIHYLGIDPAHEPVPVSPGIHYFMGGILVDEEHRTNLPNLYAAGECACAYHGANRLGGNSLLGAVFGGQRAALTAMRELEKEGTGGEEGAAQKRMQPAFRPMRQEEEKLHDRMTQILLEGLPPLRKEEQILDALRKLGELADPAACSDEMRWKLLLAEAILRCALERRESRGAHTRLDYPRTDEEMRRTTAACVCGGRIRISYREIPPERTDKKETAGDGLQKGSSLG